MKVTVLPACELTSDLAALWSRLQAADPALASPFFSPEFTAAVSRVRTDVYVGILEEEGEVVGFFPFQRDAAGAGAAVGLGLNDFQGVVAAPGARWSAGELLRGCGVSRWTFDDLPVEQEPFHPYHEATYESPYLDLSSGHAAYVLERRHAGSGLFGQLARKRRKLESEVGPLRFEAHIGDPGVLQRMMRWKSDQYRRTGSYDRFAIPWMTALLEILAATRGESFAGELSALYAGDEIAALHMGLRFARRWHWWFPTFNRRLHRYSPGLLLLQQIAEHAAAAGVERLDLGRDGTPRPSAYKRSLASGCVQVAAGCATA